MQGNQPEESSYQRQRDLVTPKLLLYRPSSLSQRDKRWQYTYQHPKEEDSVARSRAVKEETEET